MGLPHQLAKIIKKWHPDSPCPGIVVNHSVLPAIVVILAANQSFFSPYSTYPTDPKDKIIQYQSGSKFAGFPPMAAWA
jgi:hypothetical protein